MVDDFSEIIGLLGCSAVWLLPQASRLSPQACFREFDLDGVLGRLGGLDTQECAGLGR